MVKSTERRMPPKPIFTLTSRCFSIRFSQIEINLEAIERSLNNSVVDILVAPVAKEKLSEGVWVSFRQACLICQFETRAINATTDSPPSGRYARLTKSDLWLYLVTVWEC